MQWAYPIEAWDMRAWNVPVAQVWPGRLLGEHLGEVALTRPVRWAVPRGDAMPSTSAHVRNEKQSEALKDKGMSN